MRPLRVGFADEIRTGACQNAAFSRITGHVPDELEKLLNNAPPVSVMAAKFIEAAQEVIEFFILPPPHLRPDQAITGHKPLRDLAEGTPAPFSASTGIERQVIESAEHRQILSLQKILPGERRQPGSATCLPFYCESVSSPFLDFSIRL